MVRWPSSASLHSRAHRRGRADLARHASLDDATCDSRPGVRWHLHREPGIRPWLGLARLRRWRAQYCRSRDHLSVGFRHFVAHLDGVAQRVLASSIPRRYTGCHDALDEAFAQLLHGAPLSNGIGRMRLGAVGLADDGVEQREDQLFRLEVERAVLHQVCAHQSVTREGRGGVLEQALKAFGTEPRVLSKFAMPIATASVVSLSLFGMMSSCCVQVPRQCATRSAFPKHVMAASAATQACSNA